MFPQQNLVIKNHDIFVTYLFNDCLNNIVSILPREQQHQTLEVIQRVWPYIARSSQYEGTGCTNLLWCIRLNIFSFSLMDSFHCISLLIVYNREL